MGVFHYHVWLPMIATGLWFRVVPGFVFQNCWNGQEYKILYIKIKLSYVNRGLGLVVNFQGIPCILEIWVGPTSHVVIGVKMNDTSPSSWNVWCSPFKLRHLVVILFTCFPYEGPKSWLKKRNKDTYKTHGFTFVSACFSRNYFAPKEWFWLRRDVRGSRFASSNGKRIFSASAQNHGKAELVVWNMNNG